MKCWVVLFFVVALFRSDDGVDSHVEDVGHWCSHELHRDAMHILEQVLEF